MLDSLAGYYPGGLKEHDVVRFQPNLLAKLRVATALRRRFLEIQNVGNQDRRGPFPPGEVLLSERINGYVLDRGQAGWKGHGQKITHRVDREPSPLPVEIVVMGDGGYLGLGNEVR